VIRESPIAGSWYEGTEKSLNKQILGAALSKFGVGYDFKNLKETDGRRLLGVVSPHAGYMYSGATATHAYATLHNYRPKIKEVFVLGPDHQGYISGIHAFPSGGWRTPLGTMEIRDNLVDAVRESSLHADFNPDSHRREHSIDIQLPMLQYAYSNILKFLPLMLSRQSLAQSRIVGEFLSRQKDVAIVASSDLSHEYDYEILQRNDRQFLDLLKSADLEEVDKFRREVGMTSCGFGAIFALLHAANLLGEVEVEELSYSNSAMVAGRSPGQYTVGYAALGVFLDDNM